MHAWARAGTPVSQVPFPGCPGIRGPTLDRLSACHGSPLVSLSLGLAPGTPCASPTSSRGPLGPGLQRGKPARPVTRARAEGRTCVRCGGRIPGPCRELRPQRAREELRGPRLLPPHPGRRKPDQRGERTASPPEAAPPAARGHAPRGPAPPHSAWAGLRASRAPRPAPRTPHPWSSCCAPSCAPRPCGPSAAPAPAASARAEPTTRTQAPCSSKSTAGRRCAGGGSAGLCGAWGGGGVAGRRVSWGWAWGGGGQLWPLGGGTCPGSPDQAFSEGLCLHDP